MNSIYGTVRAMRAGGDRGSIVVTIPADLRNAYGFQQGDRFLAGTDGKGRIVYERIGHGQGATTNVTPTRDSRATIGTVEQ